MKRNQVVVVACVVVVGWLASLHYFSVRAFSSGVKVGMIAGEYKGMSDRVLSLQGELDITAVKGLACDAAGRLLQASSIEDVQRVPYLVRFSPARETADALYDLASKYKTNIEGAALLRSNQSTLKSQ